MIACINKMLNPPRTDWSDVERLEQRIRDLRRRIREARNSQRQVFSFQGIHDKKPFNLWPDKGTDRTSSMGEGSTISPKQSSLKRKVQQETRAKEMSDLRAKMRPKVDPIEEEMVRQDRELAEAIEKAMAKQMNK